LFLVGRLALHRLRLIAYCRLSLLRFWRLLVSPCSRDMQSSGHYRGRTCYSLTFTKVKLSRFQVWIVLI